MEEQALDAFVAAAGDVHRIEDGARLARALVACAERGRTAWPGVVVSDAAFARFLADRVPDGGDPAVALQRMRCEDLYLACACARSAAGAVEAFERAIMPAVPKAVARIDADGAFVDEITSTVRVKLLVGTGDRPPRIERYLGRGPLTAFAQVVALRAAQSAKRRVGREDPVDRDTLLDVPLRGDDPELARLRDEIREPFRAAFRAALADLSVRDRNVLRLYLVEEVASETLARMYGVHRATVARWIASARDAVHAGTRKRLMKELRLGRSSFDSLVGHLASQLDVSLATFLSEGDDPPEGD
ncbi:MAG TPA: hypothetical protein RMH99_24870 [Sandaracinaceae bacterium LLY-WYZ-13_1]|nr:hypothetical protein [Sandaracinaceae bacterium LLY-WYZ-13_1]